MRWRRTTHAQLLQRIDTAWLQQLAHNPVRLFQTLLQQQYAPSLAAERNRCGTSNDASAHNDHIRFMML
jgi:hypothetical protein